jgi:hypothetical protein
MSLNICIYYLPYSGGLFVSHCLSLSKHVIMNSYKTVSKELSFNEFNEDYYAFKINSILGFVPSTPLQNWYEGDTPISSQNYNSIHSKNKKICYAAHSTDKIKKYQDQYSDLLICKLINFNQFNILSYPLKKTRDFPDHVKSVEANSWLNDSMSGDVEFDVDGAIYNKNIFVSEMKKLYDFFALDDFREDLLLQYYTKYRNWHGL